MLDIFPKMHSFMCFAADHFDPTQCIPTPFALFQAEQT